MVEGSWQDAVIVEPPDGPCSAAMKAVLRPLQLLMSAPVFLFLFALTAMLLRHPDVRMYEIDRVAFVMLIVGVLLRNAIARRSLRVWQRVTWPMAGLTVLAVLSVAGQPLDHETWSLLASKFVVPFVMFHLAILVFEDEKAFRQFEIFSLLILAYLCFTAVAFLAGADSLIFPRFILDDSLGFHADRARGPLLQAVANGVSINILGLLALHSYRRGSIRGLKMLVVLAAVPIAILATMTRAVWLSFAGSLVASIFLMKRCRLRRITLVLLVAVGVGIALLLGSGVMPSVSDRLQERGPVDYREAVYAGGWEMFLEHPWLGWGFHQMPAELPRHVSGYSETLLYPHNTYLELLVEQGLLGVSLYLWIMWELWRLGSFPMAESEGRGYLNRHFHRMWLILLAVYWVNAAVVVMSYQFVNGLLFTIAGMLAAQRRRAEARLAC